MSTVNDQVTDAVTQMNALLTGGAGSQSMGMLDIAGAETMGMSMFNAITAQQNAQTSSTAAITASCAKMLQTPMLPPDQPKNEKQKLQEELQKLELNEHKLALELAVAVIVALAVKVLAQPAQQADVHEAAASDIIQTGAAKHSTPTAKTVTPAKSNSQDDLDALLNKALGNAIANNSEFSNASKQSIQDATNLLKKLLSGAISQKSSQ